MWIWTILLGAQASRGAAGAGEPGHGRELSLAGAGWAWRAGMELPAQPWGWCHQECLCPGL